MTLPDAIAAAGMHRNVKVKKNKKYSYQWVSELQF